MHTLAKAYNHNWDIASIISDHICKQSAQWGVGEWCAASVTHHASDGVFAGDNGFHVVLECLPRAAGCVEVVRVPPTHIELPAGGRMHDPLKPLYIHFLESWHQSITCMAVLVV
jgi:hypothetical protein